MHGLEDAAYVELKSVCDNNIHVNVEVYLNICFDRAMDVYFTDHDLLNQKNNNGEYQCINHRIDQREGYSELCLAFLEFYQRELDEVDDHYVKPQKEVENYSPNDAEDYRCDLVVCVRVAH